MKLWQAVRRIQNTVFAVLSLLCKGGRISLFCENCGKNIENDASFCPECGAPVRTVQQPQPVQYQAQQANEFQSAYPQYGQYSVQQAEPAVKKYLPFIIVGISVFLILVIVLAVVLGTGSGGSDSTGYNGYYNTGTNGYYGGNTGSSMCAMCYGSGVCSVCDGTGKTHNWDGNKVTCVSCHGTLQCQACGGAGYY